jgi:hypothetical protein
MNSVLDDLGFDDTPETSTNVSKGDPAVWTVLGEAGTHPDGMIAAASTLYNRAKTSKTRMTDVAVDPGQGYEAWQNTDARKKVQQLYPVNSPSYKKAADVLKRLETGDIDPLPYTHFYSPTAQASLSKIDGRPVKPSFDDGTGVDIGGNRFFTHGSGPASPTFNILNDLGFNNTAEAAPTPALAPDDPPAPAPKPGEPGFVDPAAAADTTVKANAAGDNPSWPVYDQYNKVGRNADGSIAYIGDLGSQSVEQQKLDAERKPGGPKEIALGTSSHPDAIAAWLKAHPLDPANAVQKPQKDTPSSDNLLTPEGQAALSGVGQGLSNVSHSVEGLESVVRSNPIGDFVAGMTTGRSRDQVMADLASAVTNRNRNDVKYSGSTDYGLGKFGGEMAATVPLMAAGDEAAGAIPLGRFGKFLAGTQPGNLLVRGASLGARGAIQGTEAAGLTSAGNSESIPSQLARGAMTGAVVNPLLATGVGAVNSVKPTLGLFTQKGRDKILDNNISAVLGGKSLNADLTEYVSGSRPTLPEATQNPALAVTQRTLKAEGGPAISNAFGARADANQVAREAHVEKLLGTPEDIKDLDAARESTTSQLRDVAFANKTPTDSSPVIKKIDEILKSPAGQRGAVRSNLMAIREKIAKDIDLGKGKVVTQLENDPEQLYGIRKDINDRLSPLASRDKDNAQLAAHELTEVKKVLDQSITNGAPGFDKYIKAYSEASKPINALSSLQSLGLTDMRGNLTLGKVNSAITRLEKARASSGVDPAKDITDDQMKALYNLREDMRRSDLTVPLGHASRSANVTGNLDNQGFMENLMNPYTTAVLGAISHHPVGAFAVGAGRMAVKTQKNQITRALADRMLNPDMNVVPLRPVQVQTQSPIPKVNPFITGPVILGNQQDKNKFNVR